VGEELERVGPEQMRASDSDREKVAKVLHDAMGDGRLSLAELDERLAVVYASKTIGELIPLTSDLPVPSPVSANRAEPARQQPSRVGATGGVTTSIAVMSGFQRKGNWTVPPTHNAVALMGGGELHLTDARFVNKESVINCVAIMGGIEIIVPADVNVFVEGIGIMGAFDNNAHDNPGGDRPVVRVRGFALMGGVEVKRPKVKKSRNPELEG
jgi:hypothetical protein